MLQNCTKAIIAGMCLLFLVSCEDSTSGDKNSDTESSETVPNQTDVQKSKNEQTIKSELSAEDAVALNNQIMVQIDYIEDQLSQLQDLDAEDADSTSMYQKADSLLTYIHSFKIEGFDDKLPTLNSSDFLKSTFGLLELMDSKATIFKDYAGENSIPDLEWSEEWINELNQIIEPVFFQFIEARAVFTQSQEDFITLHGAELSEV